MKKNVGTIDKSIRISIAIVIGVLYVLKIISGSLGTGLLILAVVLLATSAISFCGLYTLFGINTCPIKEKK